MKDYKQKYFYKIKDTGDDEYSIYIWTDKKCKTLLKKAVGKYYKEECDNCVMEYIEQELNKYNIKFSIIDFDEIEY